MKEIVLLSSASLNIVSYIVLLCSESHQRINYMVLARVQADGQYGVQYGVHGSGSRSGRLQLSSVFGC